MSIFLLVIISLLTQLVKTSSSVDSQTHILIMFDILFYGMFFFFFFFFPQFPLICWHLYTPNLLELILPTESWNSCQLAADTLHRVELIVLKTHLSPRDTGFWRPVSFWYVYFCDVCLLLLTIVHQGDVLFCTPQYE